MAIHQFQTSFNAGELTPLLDARVGVEKYGSGCRRLKNMLVSVHGPAAKRPGMQYMGPGAEGEAVPRLTGLNFSATTSFVLEWASGLWRFWSNGLLVPFTLAHPYADGDLADVQAAQVNDVIYLTHPGYAPRILERYGDLDWRLREMHIGPGDTLVGWPCMLDESITGVTVAASATSGDVTLTASAALWSASHVGAWWQIAHRRESAFVELVAAVPTIAAASTAGLRVLGRCNIYSYGTWAATLYLEELQPDGATWAAIRSWRGSKDRNVNEIHTAETEATLRLRVSAGTGEAATGAAVPRFLLEATDSKVYGLARITAFTDSTHVSAHVYSPLQAADATPLWTEGAFSAIQGFPRTVCMHQQRLHFGGTRKRAQSIWGSVTADFENFRRSTFDDGSYVRQIASENSFLIQWMLSQGDLIIGTSLDEWVAAAPQDAAITPLNLTFRRQSAIGSDYRQAILIRETVIFVQRNGLALSRMSYRDTGRYGASELSILASHLFLGRVKCMAWQAQPSSVLWIVMHTGKLVGLTYEEDQNVFACHEHTTDGLVKSVAVIHGQYGDEVWLSVQRAGNYSVERFEPGTLSAGALGTTSERRCYLDASVLRVDDEPFDSVDGLAHLEGRAVSIFADGSQQPARTVEDGRVPLDPPALVACVGLPFLSQVQPMRLEAQMQDGTAQGRRFKVCGVVLRLLDSMGGRVRDAPGSIPEIIQYREVSDPMDAPPPLFSGDKPLPLESTHRESVDVIVEHDEPLPFTLLGLVVLVDIYGN